MSVFQLDRGRAALEKYAAANHLTVQVYGADGRPLTEAVNPTPLFDLFARGDGTGMFATCARQCLSPSDPRSPVIIEEQHGLAVVGTTLALAGETAGAAVAGYALTTHLSYREVVRLARDYRLPFDDVWAVTRKELPLPSRRLPVSGELLGILGNTLLSEHYRSRQLEETSLRLAEASEAKDKFLAVLSHELRTPLTTILGYAALVRNGRLDEAGVGRAVQAIERSARLQTRLIEDLLDVSRIISGSLALQFKTIGLPSVIEVAVANVRPEAQAKGLRLDVVLGPSPALIAGDPFRLQQILSNLLVNAVKFTPSGGTVEVRLERRGTEVQISVRDTGTGIRSDFLPYVFERFRQAESSPRRSQPGLGLGLAIVQHLIELHGGSVEAYSAGENKGSTFTISLPMMIKPTAEIGTIPTRLHTSSPKPTLSGIRLLLVEDDPDSLDMLRMVVDLHGAEAKTAITTAEALRIFEEWIPDVLVADIGLPDEDGYALMTKTRALANEKKRVVPGIALTGYAGQHEGQRALAAGFHVYLTKPTEPRRLVEAILNLVHHGKGHRSVI